jgi:oligogalacturonide lyase
MLSPCRLLALSTAWFFLAAPGFSAGAPPSSWTDPDTGHRVIRLTQEPGSDSFYFNVNGYTPDGKEMVYTTPDGISVLSLSTLKARAIVTGPAKAVVVGTRTPTIYYTKSSDNPLFSSLWATNVDTGETKKLADLPRRGSLSTINADETLGAGTYLEGDAKASGNYGGAAPTKGNRPILNLGEPVNKGKMMAQRLAAKLPNTMYTVDLKTGKTTPILEHSTDWLNHLQFSPTEPTLLMYCHEGAWHQVDRIWTIRTDGTQNQLMHQRTMQMEIAGHEWWGPGGKTVWYQLQLPRNAPGTGYLGSVNVETHERVWYHFEPDAVSIHHNISPDQKLFVGDGNSGNPWIVLCRPHRVKDDHTLGQGLIKGGYLEAERLVNLSKHRYALEPNPSFTPDMKFVVFRSNIFGPDYAFAVQVGK